MADKQPKKRNLGLPVAQTMHQKVSFQMTLKHIEFMKEAYEQKYSKDFDINKVTTFEITTLVFDNPLWKIERKKEYSNKTKVRKAFTEFMKTATPEEAEKKAKAMGLDY